MGHPSHPHSLGHEKPRGCWPPLTRCPPPRPDGFTFVCRHKATPRTLQFSRSSSPHWPFSLSRRFFFFSFCFIPISRYAIRDHVRRSRILWSLEVEWRYGVFSWVCDQVMACRILNYLRIKKLSFPGDRVLCSVLRGGNISWRWVESERFELFLRNWVDFTKSSILCFE